MRLNWFSPLPPSRSGIADYTLRLLPALTAVADVVLWTDQESWDSSLEHYAPVARYQVKEMPWKEINRASMSVFHIGNNHRFHGPIWQVARQHPGLVILHDTALQQFFAGLYREQWRDRGGYLSLMEHYYGPHGRQDAEDFWAGRLSIDYMAQQYHLTRYAVEQALGVLVHVPRSRAELLHDIPCPLAYAPLPYAASNWTDQGDGAAIDRRNQSQLYRLIVFGHLSENRRLGPLLQAYAGFAERDRFRLDVYGELWDVESLTRHIHALSLQSLVTLHGFVPPEELEAALTAAHLAINLRFPTMGEASVSQLQIWDHALPSLVTRVGWYAGLPADAVAFVRPDCEMADIRNHLGAFLANPHHYARIGAQGRRLLETQHTPEGYVQAILDLIGEAQAFRPQGMAHELARRVRSEMHRWTDLTTADVSAHLWGRVVGLSAAEPPARAAIAALDYHHLDELKNLRQLLSDQAQQMQRQLFSGVHALRQAALTELHPLPPRDGPGLRARPQNEAVSQGPPSAGPPALREEAATDPAAQVPPLPVGDHSGTTGPQPARSLGVTGEGSPSKSYTREDALRYPMSMQAHDTGLRYLFNFTVVAKSLGLRPGDVVLDFATGSGFVSELLNRFGYVTIAFDIDHELLAISQERLTLDPRCDPQRTRFVSGDGMCLPFQDDSFDGIICMNALHHMSDYQRTLAEMLRVLKAGGRAVFAEPGDEHSKSPESIIAIEQYGAVEKDIVLAEIHRLARRVGFRRMILKPYVVPELLELDYEEFGRFAEQGTASSPFLSAAEIATFVRGQPLFYLEKSGTRPLTSTNAPSAALRAKIVIKECSARVTPPVRLKVVALCENAGPITWLATPREFGGYVTLGLKLLAPDGRVLVGDWGRQWLAHDVPPGGRIEVVTEVSIESLAPGRYRILFDMVNEQICWFQAMGSEVTERWVEVV